jgi:SAM-dependent methyltransferase
MSDAEHEGGLHPGVEAYAQVIGAYDSGRPSYPDEAVRWVTESAGIGSRSNVLDLAAGTGKLTRLLLSSGAKITAVEPLAAFRESLSALPVTVRDGTAEAIPAPDASVELVTVGTAFHWFDAKPALAEIARVLRPGGTLAILWNERDHRDKTQTALTEMLEPYRRDEPRQSDETWLGAFEDAEAFTPPRKRDFLYDHRFTPDSLVERVKSISFIATLKHSEREVLLDEVRSIGNRRGPKFVLPHLTHVYLAHRR